jgi:hypothetical protein
VTVAYADPPYAGKAKMYGVDETIDQALFLVHLDRTFPDGWAYSLSSSHLKYAMSVTAAQEARVAAWVKPWAVWKPGINPSYAWEPVLFKPARKRQRGRVTVRDYVIANAVMGGPCKGSKPEDFCYWLFDLLQLEADDEFVDLFPGSGRVSRCWERWQAWRTP